MQQDKEEKKRRTFSNEATYQKSLYVAQEVLLLEVVVRTGATTGVPVVAVVVVSFVLFVVISDLTRLAIWDLVCLRK